MIAPQFVLLQWPVLRWFWCRHFNTFLPMPKWWKPWGVFRLCPVLQLQSTPSRSCIERRTHLALLLSTLTSSVRLYYSCSVDVVETCGCTREHIVLATKLNMLLTLACFADLGDWLNSALYTSATLSLSHLPLTIPLSWSLLGVWFLRRY